MRFGQATALDRLDLRVEPDELFVLLGGSGSGKTTLLRAIAGFLPPAAGRILLDGQDLAAVPPHRRPVNTMFQSYALFPHLSVAQNVAFGLRRMARRDVAARVDAMLDLVRMRAFAARRPHQLSGGQQQRVALARSLAPNPKLLLLDEPLSALDRGLREQTRAELVALQRRLGIAFILVTHDQQEALTMATRIGVMQEGRLCQIGTPAEIYERPATRYVAEFLGAANILPASILQRDATRTTLSVAGAVVAATAPAPAGDVILAIRPERLRIVTAAPDTGNSLSGTIVASDYAGDMLLHTVRLPDGTDLRASTHLADGIAIARLAPGAPVTLTWSPDACILLPA